MNKVCTFNQLGRYGRLGNQMFQIASVIGIALKNNCNYAFPQWINYDHVERFGSSEDCNIFSYFQNRLPVYNGPELPDRFIPWGFHNITTKGNESFSGHMQSEKYFLHCEQTIRYHFRLKERYDFPNTCAIHIRFGDYDNVYHPIMQKEYYMKAIEQMPEGIKYMVFSDEPEKAKALFADDSMEYVEGNHYMTDFAMMQGCNHFIIANSTFSWWGAWLSDYKNKIVVAPKKWFGDAALTAGYVNDSPDIYCQNWITV